MTVETINRQCPWSGGTVSVDSLTTYRGREVGFCNPGCRDKFEKASRTFDAIIGNEKRDPILAHFDRSARYNSWFNDRILQCIAKLTPQEYRRDAGAYFGSVEASINHIMVWDVVWLKRIAPSLGMPTLLDHIVSLEMPTANDQILKSSRSTFLSERQAIDGAILSLIASLDEDCLTLPIRYRRQSGLGFVHQLGEVLQHMFNHQTHHRGQIVTLLSQFGKDLGVTDLIAMLIEEEETVL